MSDKLTSLVSAKSQPEKPEELRTTSLIVTNKSDTSVDMIKNSASLEIKIKSNEVDKFMSLKTTPHVFLDAKDENYNKVVIVICKSKSSKIGKSNKTTVKSNGRVDLKEVRCKKSKKSQLINNTNIKLRGCDEKEKETKSDLVKSKVLPKSDCKRQESSSAKRVFRDNELTHTADELSEAVEQIESQPTVRVYYDEIALKREGYCILRQEEITSTSQSCIFHALHPSGTAIACKIMLLTSNTQSRRKHLLQTFPQISRYFSTADCSNLHTSFIPIYDIFQIDLKLYIFMEHVESRNLVDLIKSGKKFTQSSVQQWLKAVCEAIIFTHKRAIAHCALKLNHILINFNNQVKICDWSKAVVFWNAIKKSFKKQKSVGRSHHNYHMPPEAFRDYHDPRQVDIWAIGVLLAAIHTDHYVFNPKSDNFVDQWKTFAAKHRINPVIFDFLSQLFLEDPNKRLTLTQMLDHGYFETKFSVIELENTKDNQVNACKTIRTDTELNVTSDELIAEKTKQVSSCDDDIIA